MASQDRPTRPTSAELLVPDGSMSWQRRVVPLPLAPSLHGLALMASEQVLEVFNDGTCSLSEFLCEFSEGELTPGLVDRRDSVKQPPNWLLAWLLAPMAAGGEREC